MRRVVSVVVLLSTLAGLCVHYGAVAAEKDPYPTGAQLASEYDQHIGDEYYEWVTVEQVDADSFSFAVQSSPPVLITVTERPAGVNPGDVVQVYGTVAPDRRLVPTRLIESDRSNLRALYLVSAVAVLLTGSITRRYWRLHTTDWGLVPREPEDE